ncbi:50S ribosomal protein L24 [Candidatus Uhrbacteria bacterium]|nr:50S ribosomal protein L24 [Candidatus Uhrbacteria bacterium]
MNIRKNDTVKIIAGKDRGKTGKVLKAFPSEGLLVVEGVNIVTKHVRTRQRGEKGQKVYFPGRINVSKVMVVCPKCGQPTRVGMVVGSQDLKQKKERICKKCKQSLTA